MSTVRKNFALVLRDRQFAWCLRCKREVDAVSVDASDWGSEVTMRVRCHQHNDVRRVSFRDIEIDPGAALEKMRNWFEARPLPTFGLRHKRNIARRGFRGMEVRRDRYAESE